MLSSVPQTLDLRAGYSRDRNTVYFAQHIIAERRGLGRGNTLHPSLAAANPTDFPSPHIHTLIDRHTEHRNATSYGTTREEASPVCVLTGCMSDT